MGVTPGSSVRSAPVDTQPEPDAEPRPELLIPQAAVQRDQRGPFVLVVGPQQTVEQRYITTGAAQGTEIIVETGLAPGESVIVEGLQRVKPGVPVQPVTAAPKE